MNSHGSPRRRQRLLPVLALLAGASVCTGAAAREPVVEPAWKTRNEITVMGGYRLTDDLQVGLDEDAVDPDAAAEESLALEETASFTLIYDRTWPHRPYTQLEIYLSRQRTSLTPAEPFAGRGDFELDVYYAHAGGLYLFEEQGAVPFIGATLGITHLRPTDSEFSAETRFSMRLAGGVKIPLARHVGLRLEASGLFTFFDTNASIFCSGGCVARIEGNAFSQVDLGAGLTFAF